MHSNGVQRRRRWEVDDDYNITYKRSTYTRNHLSIHDWCGTYNNIQKRLNWVLQRVRTMVRRHFIHIVPFSPSLSPSLSLSRARCFPLPIHTLYSPRRRRPPAEPREISSSPLRSPPSSHIHYPLYRTPTSNPPRHRRDNRTEKLVK